MLAQLLRTPLPGINTGPPGLLMTCSTLTAGSLPLESTLGLDGRLGSRAAHILTHCDVRDGALCRAGPQVGQAVTAQARSNSIQRHTSCTHLAMAHITRAKARTLPSRKPCSRPASMSHRSTSSRQERLSAPARPALRPHGTRHTRRRRSWAQRRRRSQSLMRTLRTSRWACMHPIGGRCVAVHGGMHQLACNNSRVLSSSRSAVAHAKLPCS